MHGRWILPLALIAGGAAASAAPSLGDRQIASIDLSKPFAARSPWRFTATQGPEIRDDYFGNIPGAITPCISKASAGPCSPDLVKVLRVSPDDDPFSQPHYLQDARIVHPEGNPGRALLLVRLASQQSINGDQRVALQLLAYDRAHDRFAPVFAQTTGRNNNQELRYVFYGQLKGMVITAEPTSGAPFGYWITVHRLTPAFTYRQLLRFRSATRYGDGNSLAVIDSEMPNIRQRLGLWHPGEPLPLPMSGGCAKPQLKQGALWCN